jgi:hypothetical protein
MVEHYVVVKNKDKDLYDEYMIVPKKEYQSLKKN